jgi:hypothetical protein
MVTRHPVAGVFEPYTVCGRLISNSGSGSGP